MRNFLIKLAVGIVGLVILAKFGSVDLAVLTKAARRPELLAVAFLCILATVPIGALRWWMLLRGLRFTFTLPWVLSTTFIGQFFNTFLPGAYGGDLVRLAMAYRVTGRDLNRLTFSVVTDRLMGLIALLGLATAMVPAIPVVYVNRLEWIAVGTVVLGAAGIAFGLTSSEPLARLVGRLPAPVGPLLALIVRELTGALKAYVTQPWLLIAAVAISLVQYAFALATLMVLGSAMQFKGLSWPAYVVAGTWSLIANSLPITPGGIGVGEAAFAHVAMALADSSADDLHFGTIFLAMRVLTLIIGVGGLLPWLLHRTELRSGVAAVRMAEQSRESGPPADK
jgi:uncharacterized membrane protein YbhN (UPF0104 family)